MKVTEYEHTLTRVCLDASPSPDDVTALGGQGDRWLLYRHMVRQRWRHMVRDGLPRTTASLGEAYEGLFSEFLANRGVRSRFIRDVVSEFSAFLRSERPQRLTASARDLMAYETGVWELRDLPEPELPAVEEFDFERTPVVNPVHRLLTTAYPVHERDFVGDPTREGRFIICLYRNLMTTKVRYALLDEVDRTLLELWRDQRITVTESVHRLAAEGALELTPELVGRLAERLAAFIEGGLILGSAP